MCYQNYWQFILHLWMTSIHLRKLSTISSSHNGIKTCEKPDHILKKKQWMIVSLHRCDDFYILKSLILLQRSCLKTNKMKQVSDSCQSQTLTRKDQKGCWKSKWILLFHCYYHCNTLIQGSTVHLSNAKLSFGGQPPRPDLNLQDSMHVSVTVCSHLQSSEAYWNQLRRQNIIGRFCSTMECPFKVEIFVLFWNYASYCKHSPPMDVQRWTTFPRLWCFLFSCDCSETEVVLMPLYLVSVNHMQNSQESR